jgi:RNA polymerase sigma-70 factor, ECF subfamily
MPRETGIVAKERDPGRWAGMARVEEFGVDEAGLLARAAAGEAGAFRLLARAHMPRVLRVARRMLGNDSDAEDVAQEAMYRLWRNAARIEVQESGLGAWLYRVTSNLSLDRLRGKRSESPEALDQLTVPPEQDRQLVRQDLARRVDKELQALPERQRMALVLCHYEGLSMAEAGAMLGVSAEAIESLLARGRRALKAALVNDWRALIPAEDENDSEQVP